MTLSLGVNAKSDCEECVTEEIAYLQLTENNTVTLKGAVTFNSVSDVGKELLELSGKIRLNSEIYLILDSPGGSIYAGLNLISLMKLY